MRCKSNSYTKAHGTWFRAFYENFPGGLKRSWEIPGLNSRLTSGLKMCLWNIIPRIISVPETKDWLVNEFAIQSTFQLAWNPHLRRNLRESELDDLTVLLLKFARVDITPGKKDFRKCQSCNNSMYSVASSYQSMTEQFAPDTFPYSLVWITFPRNSSLLVVSYLGETEHYGWNLKEKPPHHLTSGLPHVPSSFEVCKPPTYPLQHYQVDVNLTPANRKHLIFPQIRRLHLIMEWSLSQNWARSLWLAASQAIAWTIWLEMKTRTFWQPRLRSQVCLL